MLAQKLRSCHRQAWQALRSTRNYNANAGHTTYFQQPPPPPRKWPRRLAFALWSTTCVGIGAYGMTKLALGPLHALVEGNFDAPLHEAVTMAVFDAIAKSVPPLGLDDIDEVLQSTSGYSVMTKV